MDPKPRHILTVVAVIIGVLALTVILTTVSIADGSTPAPDDTTTCFEWAGESTEAQQRAYAAAALAHAQDKADGGEDRPEDSLIDEFDRQIDSACSADGSQYLEDVAVGVYLRQRATFRP